MSSWARSLFCLPLLCAAGVCQQPDSAFLNRYCTGCHNSKVKAGELALDGILSDNIVRHPETWEKVIRKLRARYMPPPGLPRPDDASYQSFIHSLEAPLDAAAVAKANPGRTDTFRRLNRTEYQNAVRDLLALDVDVAALLPSDDLSHGFDNVTVGNLSPTLLERYVDAARKISRLAMGSPTRFDSAR